MSSSSPRRQTRLGTPHISLEVLDVEQPPRTLRLVLPVASMARRVLRLSRTFSFPSRTALIRHISESSPLRAEHLAEPRVLLPICALPRPHCDDGVCLARLDGSRGPHHRSHSQLRSEDPDRVVSPDGRRMGHDVPRQRLACDGLMVCLPASYHKTLSLLVPGADVYGTLIDSVTLELASRSPCAVPLDMLYLFSSTVSPVASQQSHILTRLGIQRREVHRT